MLIIHKRTLISHSQILNYLKLKLKHSGPRMLDAAVLPDEIAMGFCQMILGSIWRVCLGMDGVASK